jgi:ComF family protein
MRALVHPLADLARRLANLLLPPHCLGCSTALSGGPTPLLLCVRCRGGLRPIDPARACTGCLRPLPPARDGRGRCLACLADPPPCERLIAVWSYRPPLDRVLRALKFGRLEFLAEALVDEALAREPLAGVGRADRIVPVPLAPVRRLGRGFNQAERLAAALAGRLGLPVSDALARHGLWPPPQTRLGRAQRRASPRAAFRLACPAAVAGGRILLVDDVVTTGATLRAAARALIGAGGARAVLALAVAATPAVPLPNPPAGELARLDRGCTPP